MALLRAMATIAWCDYCPNSLPHVSSETSAVEFFARHRYTLVEIPSGSTLVACGNRACKAELNKTLVAQAEADTKAQL